LLKHSRFKWWESKGIIFYLIVNSSENWNDKTVLGFMYKQKLMPWEFLHGNLLKMRTVKSGSLGSPNFATCTGKMYCSCSSLSRLLFQNFTPKKTVCCFFLSWLVDSIISGRQPGKQNYIDWVLLIEHLARVSVLSGLFCLPVCMVLLA